MNTLFSEAIKLKDGVLCRLEYHQQRVDRTLERFYGTTIDLSVLKENIPDEVRKGLYKCRVVYGRQIESVEFIPYRFRSIQKVCIVKDDDIEYDYKYADRARLNELLEKSACDDIIIVKRGFVTDSFAANLVFQSRSGLYTPASCLLPGTKRQYLLDQGIVRETEIRLEDLPLYDRVFFVNALVDLEDGLSVGVSSLL